MPMRSGWRARAGCSIRPTGPMPRRGLAEAANDRSSSIRFCVPTEPVMNHFDYRNGVLHAEAVDLIALADAVGTPFYCYSTATLERHYRVFADAFADVK